MLKQGRIIIIIGTLVTLIASFMVPADNKTRLINVLVVFLFGVIAVGSSVLFERVYQKIHKKWNECTFSDWSSIETKRNKTIFIIIGRMLESADKCNFDYVDSQTSNRSSG